jgi:hypothetical protein
MILKNHLRNAGSKKNIGTLATASALFIGGCAQWGANVLEENHVAFNTAVCQAMDSQMLLNIVRMSMEEPTQWMMVSAINVNTSVGGSLNGGVTIPSSGFVSGTSGGATSFTYTPNITMIPKQGEQLARELMSPIPVSSIESMVSASWPMSWVIFLTCEQFQNVSSFDVTRGFEIHTNDPRFGRMMQLFDELQSKHLTSLSLSSVPIVWNEEPIQAAEVNLGSIVSAKKDRALMHKRPDGMYDYVSIESVPVLTMYEGIQNDLHGEELLKLLDLEKVPGSYRMISVENPLPGKHVSMRTRSLAALMRLMSFGVDSVANAPPPQENVDTPEELWNLLSAINTTNDLSRNVNAVFRVHRGARAPSDATVSVAFRGQQFWIEASDRTTKEVFALVRDLYDLQVKSGNETTPVLTIPVGR